jgi:hypothetical protein
MSQTKQPLTPCWRTLWTPHCVIGAGIGVGIHISRQLADAPLPGQRAGP